MGSTSVNPPRPIAPRVPVPGSDMGVSVAARDGKPRGAWLPLLVLWCLLTRDNDPLRSAAKGLRLCAALDRACRSAIALLVRITCRGR